MGSARSVVKFLPAIPPRYSEKICYGVRKDLKIDPLTRLEVLLETYISQFLQEDLLATPEHSDFP